MFIEVNCETGEITERPLTKEELKVQAETEAYWAKIDAEEAEKAAAKAALLAKLGITEDEAKLLLA